MSWAHLPSLPSLGQDERPHWEWTGYVVGERIHWCSKLAPLKHIPKMDHGVEEVKAGREPQ